MPKIMVVKPFRHAVGTDIHATEFQLGEQEIDEHGAEVAFRNGWARPLGRSAEPSETGSGEGQEGEEGSGALFDPSGPESGSSSPEEAPASQPKTSRGRGKRAG